MILPDVNVLVFAFRRESEAHKRYAAWLAEVVSGGDELALLDHTLVGFVRIVTNRLVVPKPAPIGLALEFVTRLLAAPRARWLPAGTAAWKHFGELASADRGIAGNLGPDAYLAGTALAHNCRLATSDRGFARFPGLDWFDPGADPHSRSPRQPR